MAADITRRAKQLTGSQSTLGSLRQRRWWLASFSPGLFCLKKSLVSFVFLSFRVWQHFCFFVMSVSHPCWMRLSAVEGSKWAHVPLLFHLLLPPPTGMAFLFSFSPSFGVCVGPIFFSFWVFVSARGHFLSNADGGMSTRRRREKMSIPFLFSWTYIFSFW